MLVALLVLAMAEITKAEGVVRDVSLVVGPLVLTTRPTTFGLDRVEVEVCYESLDVGTVVYKHKVAKNAWVTFDGRAIEPKELFKLFQDNKLGLARGKIKSENGNKEWVELAVERYELPPPKRVK